MASANAKEEKDLAGEPFGRLTARRLIRRSKSGNVWLCDCSCGGKREVQTGKLTSGAVHCCVECCRRLADNAVNGDSDRHRELHRVAMQRAARLYRAYTRQANPMSMRKLAAAEGVSLQRISQVLKWYVRNRPSPQPGEAS